MSQTTKALIIMSITLFIGAGALALASPRNSVRFHYAKGKVAASMQSNDGRSGEIFFRGLPLSKARAQGWPGLEPLLAASAKFPTLASCVVSEKTRGDQLRIDWTKVSSDAEASVCLARVASSLGDAKKMAAWLGSQGFKVIVIRRDDESATSSEAEERSGTMIEAFWHMEKNGALVRGSFVTRTLQSLAGHGTSAQIFFSEPSRIVSVNVTTNYL